MEQQKKIAQQSIFCEQTIETVARQFGFDDDFIFANTRKREVVYARQICMTLIKKHTKLSLAEIGEKIGDKDHATVIHAVKTISNLIDSDKQIKSEFANIENLIMCKMNVLLNKTNGNNDFYYVNFDNYNSVRFSDDKGIVFTGFSELEIFRILTFLDAQSADVRKHKNTGYYILEK